MKRYHLLTVSGLLAVAVLACGLPGFRAASVDSTPPSVVISSPAQRQVVPVGQEVQVVSTAVDPDGITRTELVVDGVVVWVDANADPQAGAPFIVSQPWTPAVPGSHIIQARAFDMHNQSGMSDPLVVEVVPAAGQPPASPTPESTAAPLAPSPTVTRQPAVTPTPVPVSPPTDTPTPPSPTPTATPTPGQFSPTGFEPEGRFREAWLELGNGQSRLGYPTAPTITDRPYARQYFERGLLFWWDNPSGPDYIWALDAPAEDMSRGSHWARYTDDWPGGDDYSCDAARANGGLGPLRGFGYLWCSNFEVQARLGNPRQPEAGSGSNPPFSQVQFFQGGVMLYNPFDDEIYVLYAQGDWLRVR